MRKFLKNIENFIVKLLTFENLLFIFRIYLAGG